MLALLFRACFLHHRRMRSPPMRGARTPMRVRGHALRFAYALAAACLVLFAFVPGCLDDDPEDADPCAASGPLDSEWTLAGDGLSVAIRREPFGFEVKNAQGETVLASREANGVGAGAVAPQSDAPFATDGALAWAPGDVAWDTIGSPGYFRFSPALERFRERWDVVSATRDGASRITFMLRAQDRERSCIRVMHEVSGGRLRVEASRARGTARAWSAAFTSPKDEGFLGFGERFNRVEQRGRILYSWSEEGGIGGGEGRLAGPNNPGPNGESMTYYPVPFFVSTRGYGFWLDTTHRSEFDLARTDDSTLRVSHVGPSLAFEVFLPGQDDGRPWPYRIVDAFTARTGRPMVPPSWTFGPRRRINHGNVRDGVPEIQAMRDRDLALTSMDDAIHFLPDASEVGNEETIENATARARALGIYVNGYFNPYLANDPKLPVAPLAQEGLEAGHFLLNRDGTPNVVWLISGGFLNVFSIDFTKPSAGAWFGGLFERAVRLGYRGFMIDFGEYVQADTVAHDGSTGDALHNLYPVLYQKAVHDGLERTRIRGDWLAFARSGYTGASQYVPMVWGGDPAASFEDADGLPSMVRAGITLGISGVPHFGGDIGGFHCVADDWVAADGELLTRWIQMGSMTSNMQDQDACVGRRTSGQKASIFTSKDAEAAWRTYARLHTRMLPYFESLAHEAHRTGAPVMRSLFFEHPERRELAAVDDAYYLGPSLLVAPVVTRGAREKSVELPDALYVDVQDHTLVRGGRSARLPAPLAKLPLLLRPGQIVPLLDAAIDTLAEEDSPDVVGPNDVADVYDVVVFLSEASPRARFSLANGEVLEARLEGLLADPEARRAASEADLAACDGCFDRTAPDAGLTRLRFSTKAAEARAGGLVLGARTSRRIRWDVYVAGR